MPNGLLKVNPGDTKNLSESKQVWTSTSGANNQNRDECDFGKKNV
jgi:hypothetical protein